MGVFYPIVPLDNDTRELAEEMALETPESNGRAPQRRDLDALVAALEDNFTVTVHPNDDHS